MIRDFSCFFQFDLVLSRFYLISIVKAALFGFEGYKRKKLMLKNCLERLLPAVRDEWRFCALLFH